MKKLKRYREGNSCYFITTKTIYNRPFFSDIKKAEILLSNIYQFRHLGFYLLLGFVIMPDHLHLIIVPKEGVSISKIMQSIKGNNSWMINKQENSKGSLWQPSFHDRIIRDRRELYIKLNYIHENPMRRGLVKNPEDWPYTSANPDLEIDFNLWVT